jgi:hypothetical protein
MKMLDFICAIPEEIGWALVGVTATLCIMMGYKLCKFVLEARREREEDLNGTN